MKLEEEERFSNGYSSFVNRSWFAENLYAENFNYIYLNLLKIEYNIHDIP